MEKKGASKMAAWLGLGLGALALLLVVYTQWLGPTMEANRMKAEAQKAEQQSEARRQTYQDFSNDGGREEYESGEKAVDIAAASEKSREELVNKFNESSTHTLYDRNIDPDSIEFLDLYFSKYGYGSAEDLEEDLVVRYCAACEGDTKIVVETYYDLPQEMYEELVWYAFLAHEMPLSVVIGYVYEYRDDIQGSYISVKYYSDDALSRIITQGKDDAVAYYDADTFYYEMGVTPD